MEKAYPWLFFYFQEYQFISIYRIYPYKELVIGCLHHVFNLQWKEMRQTLIHVYFVMIEKVIESLGNYAGLNKKGLARPRWTKSSEVKNYSNVNMH